MRSTKSHYRKQCPRTRTHAHRRTHARTHLQYFIIPFCVQRDSLNTALLCGNFIITKKAILQKHPRRVLSKHWEAWGGLYYREQSNYHWIKKKTKGKFSSSAPINDGFKCVFRDFCWISFWCYYQRVFSGYCIKQSWAILRALTLFASDMSFCHLKGQLYWLYRCCKELADQPASRCWPVLFQRPPIMMNTHMNTPMMKTHFKNPQPLQKITASTC